MPLGLTQNICDSKPGDWVCFVDRDGVGYGIIGQWNNSKNFLIKIASNKAYYVTERGTVYTIINPIIEPNLNTLTEFRRNYPGALCLSASGNYICFNVQQADNYLLDISSGVVTYNIAHPIPYFFSEWALFQETAQGNKELLRVKFEG